VGWLTYLAAERNVDTVGLPSGVAAEALAGGTMLTIGDDVSQASDATVRAERNALGRSVLSAG
jgi:hypothetical protein